MQKHNEGVAKIIVHEKQNSVSMLPINLRICFRGAIWLLLRARQRKMLTLDIYEYVLSCHAIL